MKRTVGLLCFVLIARFGSAQLHPVEKGSDVQFTIRNFGFNVKGSLSGLKGDIRFNPDDPANAQFDINVDAATINTDNNMRDGHLRGEDYLNVEKYPRIHFLSLHVKGTRKGHYEMTGSLTIRDKTREVRFPFTAEARENGYLFTGSFKINRKDFGVGGSSTISDQLTVDLKVLAR